MGGVSRLWVGVADARSFGWGPSVFFAVREAPRRSAVEGSHRYE
jgi:hypothetical protein